ncbi:hypothetical protein AB0J72_21520 [Dactylosporangium sp. NPDC049742]|uniref:hypothetical protein n=1 Tax=Dactylosporangium sp. NPDC049742 TaxID=3154737 RepID=UPI003434B4FB
MTIHLKETTRMRFAGAVLVVALATVSGCSVPATGPATPAAPPPGGGACASSPLPLPPDANGLDIRGVDPAGRLVVAVPNHNGSELGAMLWTDGGSPQPLPAGKDISVAGVNASGVVAGSRHVPGVAGGQAVLIRDGKVVPLPMPGAATATSAAGINSRGDVAGTATLKTGGERAVLWPAGAATPVLLAVEARDTSAVGINDDGVVVGNAGQNRHGYRWTPDGTATALAVPDGYLRVAAVAVGGDWALGVSAAEPVERDGKLVDDPAHPSRGVRWNLRSGAAEILDKMVGPMAIGASGVAAGAIDGTGRPAVWHDGAALVLPMPMPDPAPSMIDWVGPDGRTMIGTVRHDDLGAQLAVWRGC